MLEETLSELEENLEIIATQKEKFTAQTLMANFNFSAIIRSENQKFPTLNVRKKLSSSEKVVVQLQHEILSLNKIVDDITNKSKTLENLLQKTYTE